MVLVVITHVERQAVQRPVVGIRFLAFTEHIVLRDVMPRDRM